MRSRKPDSGMLRPRVQASVSRPNIEIAHATAPPGLHTSSSADPRDRRYCSRARTRELARELMTLRNSGPPGTVGTVGTMVPRSGGGRVNRGPRDHPEAIIYMSRATPRKAKGAAGWPGSRPARLASGGPLAHRDHGPDGPDGPEGVEELLRRRRAPSRVSGGGSSLAAAGAGVAGGTIGGDGPGEATRARGRSSVGSAPLSRRGSTPDLRLLQLWFACLASSTGCGLRPSRPRPVVPRAPRPRGRRFLVTSVVPNVLVFERGSPWRTRRSTSDVRTDGRRT